MQYRLVKKTHHNRIKLEDGPGSLRHVVQSVRRRVFREWEWDDEMSVTNVLHQAQREIPRLDELEDSRVEEVYTLERRKNSSSEWKYLGTLEPESY